MFVLFEDVIIDNPDLDLTLCLARMEDQRSLGEVVICVDISRPVLGPVVNVSRRVGDVATLQMSVDVYA